MPSHHAQNPTKMTARGLHISAVRWTLIELVGLVAIAAFCARFAATGSPALAVSLFVFAVCTRIAIVDYSFAGDAATGLVMLSGVLLLFLGVFWTLDH